MNKLSTGPSGSGRLPAEPFPRLGDYQLIKRVGLIGVAEVHLARRVGPSGAAQHVVLRRPRPELARDPAAMEMFTREVRVAGMLRHPGSPSWWTPSPWPMVAASAWSTCRAKNLRS
jgi:serine/threonine protein kinase